MKHNLSAQLRQILSDTASETEAEKRRLGLADLKEMAKDAPPLLGFRAALADGRALIGEVKQCSPSQGRMVPANVEQAPQAYRASRVVKAVSVLTNRSRFGPDMSMENLRRIKVLTNKPVLRKDFITEDYQVWQARAFGADALLLMANILDREELRRLSDLAFSLGLDVLFETHRESELADLPETARIVGINCRNFDGGPAGLGGFWYSRMLKQWFGRKGDASTNTKRFEYAASIPSHCVKIAESGVHVGNCAQVFALGFQAVLIGTSLLMAEAGIERALAEFEQAILGSVRAPADGPGAKLHPTLVRP